MSSRQRTEDTLGFADALEFVSRGRRTICLTVVVITGMVALWTLMQPQRFEAKCTLMLRDKPTSGLALAGLGGVGGISAPPPAAREIALLSSRSMAEQVVAVPKIWSAPASLSRPFSDDGSTAALGLTTDIWPEDRVTYARLLHGAAQPHRLHATYQPGDKSSPDELAVSFLTRDKVRIGEPGLTGPENEVELSFVSGEVLEFDGGTLRLAPVGAFVGKSYRVRQVGLEDAIASLMQRTHVREVGRNSGVIDVTIRSADPYGASDVANALVQNYLDWTVNIEGRAASQTMVFLGEEMERVSALLDQAGKDLLEVAGDNARGLNITESAAAVIGRLSEYEADRTKLQLARVTVKEAAQLVNEGHLEALSRLPADLPDALTLAYLRAIGELATAATQLERSDVGAYKSLMQVRVTELEAWGEQSGLRVAGLRRLIRALDEGRVDTLAMNATLVSADDYLSSHYMQRITELDAEIAELQQVATESHPDLEVLVATRAAVLLHARTDLGSQLAGLELALADHAELVSSWRARIEEWPVAERSRLDAALADLTARVVGHLHGHMAGLDTQLEGLADAVARAEAELASLPVAEQALADAMRRQETYASIVRVLLEARQQAQLQRAGALPAAVIVDRAVPVLRPAGPGLLPNLVMGVVLALMLGLGLTWLLNSIRAFVTTAAELEEVTGLSSLGTLPSLTRGRLFKRSLASDFAPVRDRPESPEAEVYRALRDSVEFAADPDHPVKSLAVCSSIPSEGKTMTNVNLALAFAAAGKRVLLVDADLRRGRATGFFPECTDEVGLRDVLVGTAWPTAIQSTGQPGLDLMVTGTRSGRTSIDALRGQPMRELVAELTQHYDLVVFDVPPVLALADVGVFMAGLDGVILLARAHFVPRQALASSVTTLRRSQTPLLGTVLNGSGSVDRMYGYGYHDDDQPSSFREAS
ncbi:MAG: capsular exopolysaccharide synthesis family protein [Chlamydiales bacterium]|jgi:capsular exopolysaccharide synthesis family protein